MPAQELTPARPVATWLGSAMHHRMPFLAWGEQLAADHIMNEIRAYSDIRIRGEALFVGSARERRRRWQALNDFSRQAQAYVAALEATKGTARGLLGYYAALNFAKAELLHFFPEMVVNTKIHHGLSFDVTKDSTIKGDSIRVMDNGVFPLLYEARTGKKLPPRTVLPVKRLLGCVPEIGREYEMAFGETTLLSPGWYRTAGQGDVFWPILLMSPNVEALKGSFESRALLRHFEPVQRPGNWRLYFPEVRPRAFPATYLQGRQTFSAPPDGASIPHGECYEFAKMAMGDAVETAMDGVGDFLFNPSMYKSRRFPMPAFLARYAIMFYLSSLIRYRPSRLNPNREQLTVWLLEAFARQSPDYLLANGLEGIVQQNVIFNT